MKVDRIMPVLCDLIISFDMDVVRFIAITSVKKNRYGPALRTAGIQYSPFYVNITFVMWYRSFSAAWCTKYTLRISKKNRYCQKLIDPATITASNTICHNLLRITLSGNQQFLSFIKNVFYLFHGTASRHLGFEILTFGVGIAIGIGIEKNTREIRMA